MNYSYQQPHIEAILRSLRGEGVAVDMSDTGTGKTYTTVQVIKSVEYYPLIICPLAVVPTWKEVLGIYKIPPLGIFTYEKLRLGNTKFLKRVNKQFKWMVPGRTILIFDEVHKCGGIDTLNCRLLMQTKVQRLPVILLSATLADSPLRMKALGYLLKLHRYLDFPYWIKRNGCKRNFWNGWDFATGTQGTKIMDSINKKIIPRFGGRMSIKDLGDRFPDNLIIPEAVKLKGTSKLTLIYKETIAKIQSTQYKECNALTDLIQARRLSETLKISAIMDDIDALLKEGKHLCIFVSFKDTVRLLELELTSMGIPYGVITGEVNKKERELVVKRFQADTLSVVVCTSDAGGTGISLHDLNGKYPRVSLITPPLSVVIFKQVLGRIHRAGAKTPAIQKVLFAAGTVEEKAYHRVKGKLTNLSALNDGDLLGEDI